MLDLIARPFRQRLAAFVAVRPVRVDLPHGLVSFSFDDVAASAARQGASILDRFGMSATFYVSGAREGTQCDGRAQHTAADIAALLATGHEIGCHTWAHAETPRLDDAARAADHARNGEWLRERTGNAADSFAWPYGRIGPAAKRFYGERFASCRGVQPGLNVGRIDLAHLRAVGIERRNFDAARIGRWIEAARRRRGWLILFGHEVETDPSPWGCTPEALTEVATLVRDSGLEVVTVREGVKRVKARRWWPTTPGDTLVRAAPPHTGISA
jgi:peptidoglycan/xylan/chitin deacetylase (PgdA/CDA1 family)